MPNWCENDLRVVSKTKSELQKFMKTVACKDDNSVFKISNVIPIPETLRGVEAGSSEALYEILYGSEEQYAGHKKIYNLTSDDRDIAFKEYVNNIWSGDSIKDDELVRCKQGEKMSAARAMVEKYKFNVDNYGHLTWYTWCIAKWGTKWDVSDSYVGSIKLSKSGKAYSVTYHFLTAWSPPTAALASIGEIFKDLVFKLHYYESGCGFKGKFTVKGGAVTIDQTFDYDGQRGG